jgi:hypothetical protein
MQVILKIVDLQVVSQPTMPQSLLSLPWKPYISASHSTEWASLVVTLLDLYLGDTHFKSWWDTGYTEVFFVIFLSLYRQMPGQHHGQIILPFHAILSSMWQYNPSPFRVTATVILLNTPDIKQKKSDTLLDISTTCPHHPTTWLGCDVQLLEVSQSWIIIPTTKCVTDLNESRYHHNKTVVVVIIEVVIV